MKTKHGMYQRNSFPFGYFLFGLLLMMLFGWKLFFLFPIFLMFAFRGSWGRENCAPVWQATETEKPKGKPRYEDWDEPEIV